MPTELEELVGFLGSPNPQIRTIALENVLGLTKTQPSLFKQENLTPIRNLKVIVNDIPTRAKNALTCLVNLSTDEAVRENIVKDEAFIKILVEKLTTKTYASADLITMLLANLTKSDSFTEFLLKLETPSPPATEVSGSKRVIEQLLDLFVRGAEKKLNTEAEFDYLSYVFADVCRGKDGREFMTGKGYDGVAPIAKVVVFTEHKSLVRRKGVASTIKNTLFNVSAHKEMLDPDGTNLLPYLLLPLAGPDSLDPEENLELHSDLQFLPPDKKREPDTHILTTHAESLLLLTTTKEGREILREAGTYLVLRECHLQVENDEVRDAIERVVQVLKRDEADEEKNEGEESDEDDDKIVEIL